MKSIHLNPWRELALLALIGMDLSWITSLYRLFASGQPGLTGLRVFLAFGGILLGAYLLDRFLKALPVHHLVKLAIFTAFLVVAVPATLKGLFYFNQPDNLFETGQRLVKLVYQINVWFPKELGAALAALLVALRGATLGEDIDEQQAAGRGFWSGILMLLFYGLIAARFPGPPEAGALFGLFLILGVLAMIAARISALNHQRGGLLIPFSASRLASIGGFTVWVAAGALLAAALVQWRPAFTLIAWAFSLLAWAVLILLALFMALPALAVTALFALIGKPQELNNALGIVFNLFAQLRQAVSMAQARAAEEVFGGAASARPLLMYLIAGLVLLALWWLIRRRPRRPWKIPEGQAEDGLGSEGLLDRMRQGLAREVERLVSLFAGRADFNLARRRLAAVRIRQIYASLMELCTRRECPRRAAQTPLEFLPMLDRLFPGQAGDLQTITSAYMQVRYGELPENDMLFEVEAAWERIKNMPK